MRWLAATLALLTASAALVVGIYLRDRSTSWRLPPRQAAQADAHMMLLNIAGPYCGARCSYRMIGHPQADHWVARIVDRSHPPRCVDINIQKFDVSSEHGVSGIKLVSCAATAPTQGS